MIKSVFKRVLRFIPFAAVYFLVMFLCALAVAFAGQKIFFGENSFEEVSVAYFMPEDSSYNDIGITLVKRMDSMKETVNLKECESVEEVYEEVRKGRVVAGLIIPEDFVTGVMNGDNPEIEVVYSGSGTFDELVVNDLMLSLSGMLGTGQAAMQTTFTFMTDAEVDSDTYYDVSDEVQTKTVSYVLNRQDIFEEETVDALSSYTITQKLTASYAVLVMLLSLFVFAYFYRGNREEFKVRCRLAGKPELFLIIIEAAAVFVMLYAAFVIFFLAVNLVVPDTYPAGFILAVPVVILIAALITLIVNLIENPVASSFVMFAGTAAFMYLAGGIVPLEFMPQFLRELAVYNPLYYVLRYMLEAMFV